MARHRIAVYAIAGDARLPHQCFTALLQVGCALSALSRHTRNACRCCTCMGHGLCWLEARMAKYGHRCAQNAVTMSTADNTTTKHMVSRDYTY